MGTLVVCDRGRLADPDLVVLPRASRAITGRAAPPARQEGQDDRDEKAGRDRPAVDEPCLKRRERVGAVTVSDVLRQGGTGKRRNRKDGQCRYGECTASEVPWTSTSHVPKVTG